MFPLNLGRIDLSVHILIVHCHPSNDSFSARILGTVLDGLSRSGHTFTVEHLYEQQFDPIMTLDEWNVHFEDCPPPPELARYASHLLEADGILLIYPTWWYGMPAVMKGYFDRVWRYGLAFIIQNGRIKKGQLRRIRTFGIITTYGSPWWWIRLYIGDSNRALAKRGLKPVFGRNCKTWHKALYGLDTASDAKRERFIKSIGRKIAMLHS